MNTTPSIHPRDRRLSDGSILLEVLLALMLFAGAAAVVTTAFNSSMSSLERQKLGTQALNLAASVLAEIQLGIRPANSEASQPLEKPYDDWTWQAVLTPAESAGGTPTGLTRLEVVIRHQKSTTVQRLAQVVQLPADSSTNSISATPRS